MTEARHEPTSLRNRQFGALQMDVRIDQPRIDVPSRRIDRPLCMIAMTDADDLTAADGNIGIFFDFTAQYIDQAAMSNEKVCRSLGIGFVSIGSVPGFHNGSFLARLLARANTAALWPVYFIRPA